MNYINRNRDKLKLNNYVRKASSKNDYWFDLTKSVIDKYIKKQGNKFLIIIFDDFAEGDFYAIPYSLIKNKLTSQTMTKDKQNRQRWIGNINSHQLKIWNTVNRIDISNNYGNINLIEDIELVEDDANEYAINNRKIEINARQKQSKFRKNILKIYDGKCSVSGINIKSLLIASHIVPWKTKIESRLDPSNGICLFTLYDQLFDKGFISFDSEYKLIISNKLMENENLFNYVKDKVGKKMSLPSKNIPKNEYLKFHRENIFLGNDDE